MTATARPVARLGIVGGGQLCRMTVQAARRLGCFTVVLDPTPGAPGAQLSDEHIVASFDDVAALRELASRVDVITLDLEEVSVEALQAAEDTGCAVRPSIALLATVQDKLQQKRALVAAGLPTPEFVAMDTPSPEAFEAFGYPLVHKARRGGYDGRGVAVITTAEGYDQHLRAPGHVERFVRDARELSVLVARGSGGEVRAYAPAEMSFDPATNVMDLLVAPARLSPELAARADELARATVEALDGVGIFGVELFLDRAGDIWINEVAPRPHNSGHHTVDACATGQFEQHLRAVLGLPLGSTQQFVPSALVNLLGRPGASGPAVVSGLAEALALPGVRVHLYGKAQSRPGRKMGHATVLDTDLEAAEARARRVRDAIRIEGEQQ